MAMDMTPRTCSDTNGRAWTLSVERSAWARSGVGWLHNSLLRGFSSFSVSELRARQNRPRAVVRWRAWGWGCLGGRSSSWRQRLGWPCRFLAEFFAGEGDSFRSLWRFVAAEPRTMTEGGGFSDEQHQAGE